MELTHKENEERLSNYHGGNFHTGTDRWAINVLLGWWVEKGLGTQSFAGYDQPNTQFNMPNQVSLWSLLPPGSVVTASPLLPLLGITVNTQNCTYNGPPDLNFYISL